MWAAMLHLAIGNALIGILEGLLLAWLFKAPKGRAITFMIIANYFSAWIGGLLLRGVIVHALPLDLTNAWKWFWIMVAVTYAMTLVLELPFIIPLLRQSERPVRRSLRASFVVQSTSYAILFGWYWVASGTSLYTKMHIVTPTELSLPESVIVYFIAEDGDVYSARLSSTKPEKIQELHSTNKNDRLLVRANASNPNHWDLIARVHGDDTRNANIVPVITNLLVQVAPDWRSINGNPEPEGTWFNFGAVTPLGSATTSDWKFFSGFWSVEGLSGSNMKTGAKVHFSYETPFGSWIVRNAVHLPSDKVLFQLGDDQICAFDPTKRSVALLWRGRGPVPIIK
ncbi:MAG TPA: hypothetical protein VK846_15490 [Candidatus Limnocylindria bacterium]|nr:hypothetical protein [Candidatus Limnocylindria bacterium]